MEGRGRQNIKPPEGKMPRTLILDNIITKRRRIAELAKEDRNRAFLSLAHNIDIDWLCEAYRLTRKGGATGIDGQTAADYAENLAGNLQSLLDRAKSGVYRAPPVRRTYIAKADGSQRPLGIPTFEDKILQRAVVMVLESVYEQDFYDCSYGFRPRRSAHQALEAVREQAMKMSGGWIVEVDIRKFFDTLDKACLREILRQRVRDGVILRLIDKWLHAGVLENGGITHPEAGTPQGGVISPLLANIYLHTVLDEWFAKDVLPRLKGHAWLVRYADDFVMGFACEDDARRVMDVLPKRFERYGLAIHPDKTKLIDFRSPRLRSGTDDDDPDSFDLLGFTHYWAKSQKGWWVIKRKTAMDRFTRALKRTADWLRTNRHKPIRKQHVRLSAALRGHFAYYGITSNAPALSRFRYEVIHVWRKWLCRRSQRAHLRWEAFEAVLQRFPLPPVRVVHSVMAS